MRKITVYSNEPTTPIGDLYGIFFEDLNHAADGGLYAEMVQNRAFEFSQIDSGSYRALTAWTKVERGGKVSLSVEDKNPLSLKNPHYLVMDIYDDGAAGISNEGYNSGMAYEAGENYIFSCYARSDSDITLTAALEDVNGNVYAAEQFTVNSSEWKKYTLTLTPSKTDYCGRLTVTAKTRGRVYLDIVSLFPENTFKGHGLRADLCELLADLKPKFMRFPGGCLIHDGSLNKNDRNSTYRWKNTIGPLYDRAARRNNWGYNQSLGLGYFEYFVLCEDLGAKPIPILPAGYNPHSGEAVPFDELGEWIDDALDLIEFANGDENTKWGKLRAEFGHKAPFNLEYIGIGNEEVGQEFFDRYTYFHKAIKEKYPDIKVINSSGPFTAGEDFERGWKSARENGSDFVDEHYYTSPEWFLANTHRYDDYDKNGPKVFLGEYATWGNTYYNALVEAAYMTQLENNAASVGLACYAPLFANIDYVNWKPDMIWFDNHQSFGSANYYVQKLFMNNQGTNLLHLEAEGLDAPEIIGEATISGDFELIAENGVLAEFTDIAVTADGNTARYADITVSDGAVFVDSINAHDYIITLKAKKISGPQGFRLRFGKKDKANFMDWILGGWANGDCQIESSVNGKTSSLKHKMFSAAAGVVYDLKLEVKGREITIYINGEKQFTAEDKLPAIEDLYITSCTDGNDVIIKAVNVRAAAKAAKVVIDGKNAVSGTVYELSGYSPKDENSFENPKKIYPVEKPFEASAEFEYEFPPQSVTVFRLR